MLFNFYKECLNSLNPMGENILLGKKTVSPSVDLLIFGSGGSGRGKILDRGSLTL